MRDIIESISLDGKFESNKQIFRVGILTILTREREREREREIKKLGSWEVSMLNSVN